MGILQKSLLLEALEIVTCHLGVWMSKEAVTISKQTLIVVLYSLRRPSGSNNNNNDNIIPLHYNKNSADIDNKNLVTW